MKPSKYLPWATGLIAFIIYLFTVAPSVIQIDSGELTAVQILPGIAHPTGYPLFTLLGYLWSLLPLPVTPVLKMNILAALYCTAGVGIFTKILLYISDNLHYFRKIAAVKPKGKKKQKESKEKTIEIPSYYILISAAAASLMLAFNKTFWFQSTSVEVYSLHVMLIIFIMYALLKAFVSGTDSIIDKHWLIFSILLALGFSNHMTTMLILPGTAYLYFLKYGFRKKSFLRLAVMISLFLIILAGFYSYLQLMASKNPPLNWGNPIDFERILRHISGKQYQVWLFSSAASAKKQLAYFVSNLPAEFVLSLLAAAAGIVFCAFMAKRLFIFLLICFLSTVLYSINYDIADIDSYFLLAYVSLAFFAFFAVERFLNFFHTHRGVNAGIAAGGVLVLLQIYVNFKEINQSGNYIFEDYTKAILNEVPENSLILGYQWDFFISPSYYFQNVQGIRKDVAIVDKELLRRSWYFNQVETNHPGITSGIQTEVNLFLEALKPFERDETYNNQVLESLYRRIMTGLVATNVDKRNVFIAPELFENEMQKGEFVLPAGYTIVPDLLLFKVVKVSGYVPAADPDFSIRFSGVENEYTSFIKRIAGSMLTRRAIYEMQFDKKDKARLCIDKIKKEIPDYVIPSNLGSVFN